MAKIIIKISKQGETKLQVEGVPGKQCTEITANIEEKLGDMVDKQLTSEYYNQEKGTVENHRTNRG